MAWSATSGATDSDRADGDGDSDSAGGGGSGDERSSSSSRPKKRFIWPEVCATVVSVFYWVLGQPCCWCWCWCANLKLSCAVRVTGCGEGGVSSSTSKSVFRYDTAVLLYKGRKEERGRFAVLERAPLTATHLPRSPG